MYIYIYTHYDLTFIRLHSISCTKIELFKFIFTSTFELFNYLYITEKYSLNHFIIYTLNYIIFIELYKPLNAILNLIFTYLIIHRAVNRLRKLVV